MQSQIVCGGCMRTLIYPRGATNVVCAVCRTISTVPALVPPQPIPAPGISQLVCAGCRTLLIYTYGASSVRCSCCHTVNIAPGTNYANTCCGNCRTMLMYPSGAPTVKCALCQFITTVDLGSNMMMPMPMPMQGPTMMLPSSASPSNPSGSTPAPTQTVVVENPMSLDKSGKLVSNVVVGVTTEKK